MAKASLQQIISSLQQDTLCMGALVETSVAQCIQALDERNLTLAEHVIAQDQRIDRLYRKLEQDCLNILAFHTPMARDLRHIGTILQLIRDLERIGDYAGDICAVIPPLICYPPLPQMSHVHVMACRCQEMVMHSLTALTDLDAQTGRHLVIEDDAVDADYDTLYRALAAHPMEQGPMEPFLLLLLVIRYLERMADHATNIGLRVAFIVTGER